ncbi:MAG: ABC transporter permease [Planctomycetes bacterium]|nr:ABC transporter permease [Planctomycetota bacterium]
MRVFLEKLGDFSRYSLGCVRRIFDRKYLFSSLTAQMHRIGVESLTVVNLCSFFIGLVLVIQTTALLARFDAKTEVTTILTASFIREIGPVFAAIMFAGRVGTGIAAEIGSMVVTEQIDAYRSFGADPVAKLGAPRVLATALMLPALTIIACVVGVFSGFLVVVFQLGVSRENFVAKAVAALDPIDLVACVTKAGAFGLLIGLIATYTGFRTSRAAEAVGQSTTTTMVRCVLAVLFTDLFLTKLFLNLGG